MLHDDFDRLASISRSPARFSFLWRGSANQRTYTAHFPCVFSVSSFLNTKTDLPSQCLATTRPDVTLNAIYERHIFSSLLSLGIPSYICGHGRVGVLHGSLEFMGWGTKPVIFTFCCGMPVANGRRSLLSLGFFSRIRASLLYRFCCSSFFFVCSGGVLPLSWSLSLGWYFRY